MSRAKWPKEWPGVICDECATVNGFGCIVEITEPVFKFNGLEVVGWDSEFAYEHWAHRPRPLTPAAKAMLAIARRASKDNGTGEPR